MFVPPPGSQTCSGLNGTSKYFKFSASEDKNGNFFFHPFDLASSHDGVNHTFQILNSSFGGNTDYRIELGTNGSFNLIRTITDQISDHGLILEAGMELFSPPGINTNESSDSFDNKVHVWRVGGSGWDVSTLDTATVHDHSLCDGTVNCAMDPCSEFAQGQCISWALQTPNEWLDQKP